MPMTSAQICTRAVAIAKSKGGAAVAGQYLNAVLLELCQSYDFDVCRGTYSFNFNPLTTTTNNFPNNVAGSGPYALPSDYLREVKDEFFWFINGQPYPMIACDLAEFDAQVQQQGMQSYPGIFATDLSSSPPVAVIWPPTSGSYPALLRYMRQMNDIGSSAVAQGAWTAGTTAPESATVVPWFPSTTYLYTRVAGELMRDTSDTRWKDFIGDDDPDKDTPGSACSILRRYLKMDNDSENRAKRVTLDRRRFSIPAGRLQDTKRIWG